MPFLPFHIVKCLLDIIIYNSIVCFFSFFISNVWQIAKTQIHSPKMLRCFKIKLVQNGNTAFVPVLNSCFYLFEHWMMSGRWWMNTDIISAKDPFYFFCYGYRDKPTELLLNLLLLYLPKDVSKLVFGYPMLII